MIIMLEIGKREEIDNNIIFQSLYGHIYDCLKILNYYIGINYDIIIEFCDYWNISAELFMKNIFLFVYFHDIGKLIEEFQKNIRQGKTSNNFPHAIYSFIILKELKYTSIFPFNLNYYLF